MVPEGWHVSQDEVCVTIEAAASIGSFQVSAARKKGSLIDESEVEDFYIDSIPNKEAVKKIVVNDFNGHYFEYVKDSLFWRQWYLFTGDTLVMVTYLAPTGKEMQEMSAVNEMIKSIKVR
jgi:hypothetical protein